jgi:hypothetical protein
MKYCLIQKVPFKWPGRKTRILWGHILCQHDGLALVFVPKPEKDWPHSIFIAAENTVEHVFESVGPHRFDMETDDLTEIGDKLRVMGKSFSHEEFLRSLNSGDFPFGRDFPFE